MKQEEEPAVYEIDYEIFLRINEFLKRDDIEWCVSMIDEAIVSSEFPNILLQVGSDLPSKVEFAAELLNHYIIAFVHDKCKELIRDVHSIIEFNTVVLKTYGIFVIFYQEVLHKLPVDLIPYIAIGIVKSSMKSARNIDVIIPKNSILDIEQYKIDEYISASQDIKTWLEKIENTTDNFQKYFTKYLKT